MVLRVNLAMTTRDNYLALLSEKSIVGNQVNFCPAGILLDKPAPVESLPNFSAGWVSVQDGAAQLAAGLLDVQAGHRVLDVCAAPGGKTAHILELQPQISELVAVDIDGHRLSRIEENLRRLNLTATLITADAAKPDGWWDGKPFDRILLDAPCSATGVIRRHPDIKLLRRATDIPVLTELQQAILNAIWPLLQRGGILLYATCSVLKQENEHQVQKFLTAHKDAEALPIPAEWGIPCSNGRQILTGESTMDGFYYALILKH